MRMLVASAAFIFAAFAGLAHAQQNPPAALALGSDIHRVIMQSQRDEFIIDMRGGDFLHVIVEQDRIDLIVELREPSGMIVADADSANGSFGAERIAHVAERDGRYNITVSSAATAAAAPGGYRLRVVALRRATETDAVHVSAERNHRAAEKLRVENTAESRARAINGFIVAAQQFQTLGFRYEHALSLYSAAFTFLRGSQARAAIPLLTQATPIFEELNSAMFASAVNALGGAYDIIGDVRAAFDQYRRAVEYFRRTGAVVGEGIAHNNLGKLYAETANRQHALEEYRRALELFRMAKDRLREGLALYNIGMSYAGAGEYDRAGEFLSQSLNIRRASGDRAGQAEVLTSLGLVEIRRGDPGRAFPLLLAAESIRAAVGDPRGEGTTLLFLGEAHARTGDTTRALDALLRARELKRRTADRRGEALTSLSLAQVYLQIGNLDDALVAGSDALNGLRGLNDRAAIANALRVTATIERRRGNLDRALAASEEAVRTAEDVRGGVFSPELRATYLGRQQDTYRTHIDLLMQASASSPALLSRALQTSEQSKARSLLEAMGEAGIDIRRGVDPILLERFRIISDTLAVKSERAMSVVARERTSAGTQALLREIGMLEAEYAEASAAIRKSSPAYAALIQPTPVDLIAIQRYLLDSDTTLVEYSFGTEASYAWVVDRANVRAVRLAPRDDIETAARVVYELTVARGVSNSTETPLQRQRRIAAADEALPAALRRLSDLAITPLGDLGSGSRLLVVADGALQYIPFGMLPAANSDGTYRPLIVDHEIVTMPSASVLAVQREQSKSRASPKAGVAVIADPVFDRTDVRLAGASRSRLPAPAGDMPDTSRILEHIARPPATPKTHETFRAVIPRLPFTRNEADAILRAAKGQNNFRAIDFAATKEAVLGGALKGYRIVHFATHGFLDTERPTLSSIVLSLVDRNGNPRDGFLRAQELYNLELNADLVVLSACQTGLGKSIEGEGLIGLTRGLMYAGAQRVVVSLWNVSDRATASLMSRFYRDMLGSGKTPSAALRAAQLEIMKVKGWENPYYWAPFIMQGDWR